MRSCQLCGAKSWGKVADAAWEVIQSSGPDVMTGIGRDQLRICDSCGSSAREDLIADPVLGYVPGEGGPLHIGECFPFGAPPPIDYNEAARTAQTMLERMGVATKSPETRTERLVRAMLDIATIEDTTPRALVNFAVAIEHELDRCAARVKESMPAPVLHPRSFVADFLIPVQAWADKLGAGKRVVQDLLPLALDIAIAFGALEALTGNESLSDVAKLDATYAEKVQRLSRWVA